MAVGLARAVSRASAEMSKQGLNRHVNALLSVLVGGPYLCVEERRETELEAQVMAHHWLNRK